MRPTCEREVSFLEARTQAGVILDGALLPPVPPKAPVGGDAELRQEVRHDSEECAL